MQAVPVLNVTPLPPAPQLYPIESVVPIEGDTSSAVNPSTSATCIAIAVLLPPTSGDPSTNETDPSAFTLATALAGPLPLNHAPDAIPLPTLLHVSSER